MQKQLDRGSFFMHFQAQNRSDFMQKQHESSSFLCTDEIQHHGNELKNEKPPCNNRRFCDIIIHIDHRKEF